MKLISIIKSVFILFLFIAIGCTGNQKKSQESNLENETSTESTSAQYVGEYSFQNDLEDASFTTEVNVSPDCLITQNSVGEFKVGQEINLPYQSDIYTIEREARKQHVDGSITVDVVEYHVFENGKEVLTIHPGYDSQGRFTNKINKFIILSEKFKTKEGIGVNTKIEDFAKLFPDYTIIREFSGYAYLMQSDETGGNMTFYIDVEDFLYNKTNSDETPLTISDFKKGTRIYEIYM